MNIKRNTLAALVAALLASGSLAPITAAHAAVSVQFDAGSVAFGYSDGYWDQGHKWHKWPNTSARNEWRTHNTAHYYSHAHSHDKAAGWHENDHWWGQLKPLVSIVNDGKSPAQAGLFWGLRLGARGNRATVSQGKTLPNQNVDQLRRTT